MQLKADKLRNFRGNDQEIRTPIDSLTALVGTNDIRLTILEALETAYPEPGKR
jgi:hypothetical protein